MESRTYLKNIAITPKKLRFLLKEIKRLKPVDALSKLAYMHDRPARVYYKALHSAVTNARLYLKTSDDMLEFKLLTIEQGNALKRYHPGSRGSMKPYKRRFSHIKIILIAKTPVAPKVQVKKEVAQPAKPDIKKQIASEEAKPVKKVTRKKITK